MLPDLPTEYANCNFTNVVEYANTASSNYNGLQSELRIANFHGLTATGSYTFSKTIDNASEVFSTIAGGNTLAYAQNPFDTGAAERRTRASISRMWSASPSFTTCPFTRHSVAWWVTCSVAGRPIRRIATPVVSPIRPFNAT